MSDQNNQNAEDRFPTGYFEITGIGNLGRDPEMRFTPGGKAVCNLNVACDLRTSTPEGFRTAPLWVRLTAWEGLAESCNRFLHKGSKIFFKARIEFDPVTGSPYVFTRQDGTTGTRLDLTAQEIRFLSPKQETEDQISFG